MLHKYLFTITGIALILLSSCVKEDFSHCPTEITIAYHLLEFTPKDGFSLRAAPTPPYATTEENVVENLYLFLFPTTMGQTVKKYFLSSPTLSGIGFVGTFENLEGNITLSLSPATAGVRDVYLVANCDADLKTALDAVETVEALKAVRRENTTAPWTMTTPLLMSGKSLAHDFATTPTLNKVTLTRAVAKLQIEVTLGAAHQSATHSDYGYKYLNFGTKTYVLPKPSEQTNTAGHSDWQTFTFIPENLGAGDKVNSFTLTTYINEYAEGQTPEIPAAKVQFKFPYNPDCMPPPEFGDDIYTIQLPVGVERNMLFYYNVSVQ